MDFLNIDGTNGGLTSWQLHYQPPPPRPTISDATPTNGVFPPNSTTSNTTTMVYPQSAPSAVSSPLQSGEKKRGRPRKYSTPEMAAAAAAAKRLSAVDPPPRKRGSAAATANGVASVSSDSSSIFSMKSQLSACSNTGHSFNTHIISVAAGEDVCQKVMMFMQQSECEMCIISAFGSISNAFLSLPAKPGMSMVYEGLYDIISLSGSYIHTESGGRSGGLSVCLSDSDGQIIGGGVSGPLTAANQIRVIVGTFVINAKNDTTKDDVAFIKLPSPPMGKASLSGSSFRSPVDSPHQMGDESPFLNQNQSMQTTTPHSMEWGGNINSHAMLLSPTNGDYDYFGH